MGRSDVEASLAGGQRSLRRYVTQGLATDQWRRRGGAGLFQDGEVVGGDNRGERLAVAGEDHSLPAVGNLVDKVSEFGTSLGERNLMRHPTSVPYLITNRYRL